MVFVLTLLLSDGDDLRTRSIMYRVSQKSSQEESATPFPVASNMMRTEGSVSLLVGQCGIQVGDTVFDELSMSLKNKVKMTAQTAYFSMKIEPRGPF